MIMANPHIHPLALRPPAVCRSYTHAHTHRHTKGWAMGVGQKCLIGKERTGTLIKAHGGRNQRANAIHCQSHKDVHSSPSCFSLNFPLLFLKASLFTITKVANQREQFVMSCTSGGNYEMLFRADKFGCLGLFEVWKCKCASERESGVLGQFD